MSPRSADIQKLVEQVYASSESSFYRDVWGTVRDLSDLPTVERSDFVRTPLSRRRYKEARGLVKIVHAKEGPFLSEWAFDDIGKEPWGIGSKRPMVYLDNSHDAIEKSLWCYEHGMIPLPGEPDADLSMFTAERYRIDSLITDVPSATKLLPYLSNRTDMLDSLTIIGSNYNGEELLPLAHFAKRARFVFALPETGALLESPIAARAAFVPVPGCTIESVDGTPTITKAALLVTPLIRYRVPELSMIAL